MTSALMMMTLTTFSCCIHVIKTAIVSDQKYVNTQERDMQFTQFALLERHSRCVTECAILCDRHENCVSFTHDQQQGSCRLHSKLMTSKMPYSVVVDTSLFAQQALALSWMEKDCVSDSDCPAVNSECFAGQCVCTPGYYYSVSQGTCSNSCSALNVTYTRYTNRDLAGDYYRSMDFVQDDSGCLASCNTDPQCLVIVYDEDGGFPARHCYFKSITPLDNPLGFNTVVGVHTLQRSCN